MITNEQKQKIENFTEHHKEMTLELLKQLTAIPAPSHYEEKKAAFVLQWLKKQGADAAYMDNVYNVVFPYNCEEANEIIVFMAHTDVVFPDKDPFTVTEIGDKLYAPGIQDDNANLANLLMCIKFLLEYRPVMPVGILLVANSCEEGLGNLKGSNYIYETYGSRIKEFISFDGNYDYIVDRAVGSQRYRIQVKTEGGHSYAAFGNDNAIYKLSCIIQSLYQMKVPTKAKTTYNIGQIEGGTSVNTIAESASMLYEFRSEDKECLSIMEQFFHSVINTYQKMGLDVTVEVLGIRPCGVGVDETALNDLTNRHKEIIHLFSDKPITVQAGSTDANTFLSHGIPSNVIGTSIGGRTHTREEWLLTESMCTGQKIGLASVLQYANRFLI